MKNRAGEVGGLSFSREGRKDLSKKVMLEERSKERKGTIYVSIWSRW